MDNDPNQITYFAETDFRNKKTPFGIKVNDRLRHIYIIGKTGMGKSTLLENMAAQDIKNGNGMSFIDPHGSAVDALLDYVPENRIDDVIYFSPADTNNPIAFNVMEDVGPEKRHLVAQGLLSSFKKIWGEETFSDRMEHITSNTLLALLEYPGSTMLSIPRMFVDPVFQKKVVANITDLSVKAFWEQEYKSWDDRYRRDAYSAVLNKVGQFTSNPIIRNIVGQPKSSFNFRDILDNKKILLINLSIGQVGESNADLLGSMLTTKIYLAAMSRAELSKSELSQSPPFFLYIDEFQNLANDSFADILSQARKYNLSLTLAHQYIEQMPDTVKAAIFGNVGSLISFRIGPTDAELLEKEFSPVFYIDDLVNLGFTQIYLRLMIDGVGSAPFSATTLPPIKIPDVSFREEIIEASRKSFSRPKEDVERDLVEWMGQGKKESKSDVKKTSTTSYKKNASSTSFKKARVLETPTTSTVSATPRASTVSARSVASKVSAVSPSTTSTKFVKNTTPTKINTLQKRVSTPEGSNSLKEALNGLVQKDNFVQNQKTKDFKQKGRKINEEINTSNKNKLKNVLEGIMEDQKKEQEKKEEENKVKEVSENVLRSVFDEKS